MRYRSRSALAAALIPLAIGCGLVAWRQRHGPLTTASDPRLAAVLATWPWPGSEPQVCHPAVRSWLAWSPRDGTQTRLVEFDFAASPTLRLELYDQDQDDEAPFDNHADCGRGVLGVARDLDEALGGTILSAWNGLFYALAPDGSGSHVAPVVLAGRVRYNVGNHRWTFGVKQTAGGARFEALHLPDQATLAARFDYAAAGAQLVVRDGRPLRLQPRPEPRDPPLPRPVPSRPDEAGHIPGVDHRHAARTAVGWSADSGRLWLLVVEDIRATTGAELRGGWTLADVQRFWLRFGAAYAVNLDGGPETQMLLRQRTGYYLMLPSAKSGRSMTMAARLDSEPDPGGGSLMTFYVRDIAEGTP